MVTKIYVQKLKHSRKGRKYWKIAFTIPSLIEAAITIWALGRRQTRTYSIDCHYLKIIPRKDNKIIA